MSFFLVFMDDLLVFLGTSCSSTIDRFHKHLAHFFRNIEDEDGSVGKQELTWIRDDVFDAQESFQRVVRWR